MKTHAAATLFVLLAPLALLALPAPPASAQSAWERPMSWRQAGLTETQAAAHLLDRFTYGPGPGEIERVAAQGLGNWLEGQLAGDLPGAVLTAKLSRLPALDLDQGQLLDRYGTTRASLAHEAVAAGVLSIDDYAGRNGPQRLEDALATLRAYAGERGLRPRRELIDQLRAQKLLRARYSQTQLVELLTDFWSNHFSVSSLDDRAGVYLPGYERDAIRPRVLDSFRRLLGAVARHPAMLVYLDNASSTAEPDAVTLFDLEMRDLDRLSPTENPFRKETWRRALGWTDRGGTVRQPTRRGINENYARELLELHTLGVDGGYDQHDVVAVARAFTGWTTYPPGDSGARLRAALDDPRAAREVGFAVDGEFVFRSDHHDSEEKTLLGVTLPAGRGIEDGEAVLDLLARHPSTRRHLARKLAVRFVSETPPPALLRRLEEAWELHDGDLRELVWALVESPEFWVPAARRSKVKTPLELAVSALRALDAEVGDAAGVVARVEAMGQPLYAYSAPTGFPDRGAEWIGVGTFLARFNFGLDLARGRIPGVTVDLPRFLDRRRLTSPAAAVEVFFPVVLPGRDPAVTLELIGPRPQEPGTAAETPRRRPPPEHVARRQTLRHAERAVGLLLASPEFQVR